MRGDALHALLLERGWTWDKAESYIKRMISFDIELRPNVTDFPEQRHVPWTVWVRGKGAACWEQIATVKTFGELEIFA